MLLSRRLSSLLIGGLLISGFALTAERSRAGKPSFPLAGADESTPAYSHYFSWINNTN
jgi:hypothetical protein